MHNKVIKNISYFPILISFLYFVLFWSLQILFGSFIFWNILVGEVKFPFKLIAQWHWFFGILRNLESDTAVMFYTEKLLTNLKENEVTTQAKTFALFSA